VKELVPGGTSLLMHGVPSQLQFMFKLLLNSLASDKHDYYHDRVSEQASEPLLAGWVWFLGPWDQLRLPGSSSMI